MPRVIPSMFHKLIYVSSEILEKWEGREDQPTTSPASGFNDEYIQSLSNIYGEERFLVRADKLKNEVRMLLEKTENPMDQIEVVDAVQRLGIFYHFTNYIHTMLNTLLTLDDDWNIHNLHASALRFRLLRQHGYNISSQFFRNFMNETGSFKASICSDPKGLLSLYEASYLSLEGESVLDEARVFATHHLQQVLSQNIDPNLAEEISHALEVPMHWRVLRLEARWFIDAYETRQGSNPLLLELAKLDFNMVQKMYQDDLKELSRWYTNTRLAEKMSFARDRLVEGFLWTVGFAFEPNFKYCRIMLVKVAVLITIIDDIYDVYGALDEVKLFTDVVERWDIKALQELPEYMRACFLALVNTVHEMAYDVLRDQGFNIIPHSTHRWAELCNKYLLEAEWCHSDHKPNLKEFLTHGWVSISGPLLIVHAYFCITNPLKDEALDDMQKHPEILKWTSLVLRLADDLGTSMAELKRGDNPKSIQCYMHDTGCSEEDARHYIKKLIASTWKKINQDVLRSTGYSRDFITCSINLARIAQCMYQHGDGHGVPDSQSKALILSLVIQPIPLS